MVAFVTTCVGGGVVVQRDCVAVVSTCVGGGVVLQGAELLFLLYLPVLEVVLLYKG